MSLFQKVKGDRMDAMRSRNSVVKSILTTLVGELEGLAKRNNTDVTDEMVVQLAKKFQFSNSETIKRLRDVSAITNLKDENRALEKYLPKQLSEDELRNVITSLSATNIGQVMKHLKGEYAGRYDGRLASALAKELV